MAPNDPDLDRSPHTGLIEKLKADSMIRLYAGNFLLYGGILASNADGEMDDGEAVSLSEALAPYMDDPRVMIDAVTSMEMARDSLAQTMTWLKANAAPMISDLYRCLCDIVAADGVLEENELKFIKGLSIGLDLPSDEAREILVQSFRDNQ